MTGKKVETGLHQPIIVLECIGPLDMSKPLQRSSAAVDFRKFPADTERRTSFISRPPLDHVAVLRGTETAK